MLVLGIETATNVCSVALFRDERLLEHITVDEPRSHASRLVPTIKQVLDNAKLQVLALNVIAISAGPGSYTGLRIGASTAKGLAFAASAELVAVPSLEALALAAANDADSKNILAAFPSRRGEVYAAVYALELSTPSTIKSPEAVKLDKFRQWIPPNPLVVAGPASETLKPYLNEDSIISDAIPTATTVAQLGLNRYKDGQIENVGAWEPFYLKSFVAKPPKPIF